MNKTESIPVLVLGVESSIVGYVVKEIPDSPFTVLSYDFKYFEEPLSPMPAAILCGPPMEGMQTSEVAQALRMIYPTTPIFYITSDRSSFNRKQFQKNGFTDAFLLPADQLILIETVKRLLAAIGQIKSFRTVRLMDISSENVLGFDLYLQLPVNKKYIKYASASDVLSDARARRLKEMHVQVASVSEDQISKFYQFTAAQLKKLNSNSGVSETEKKERRESAVRSLFSGIFGEDSKDDTISQGRGMMTDCQEIIKSYILDECETPAAWLDKIMNVSATGGGAYNHSANVSTYAALFSIGTGIGQTDEIALAGLLHDIGLSELPLEIANKQEADMTDTEKQVYQRHPVTSVNMLKEKKLIMSEKVMKIIEQHHERFDGKGYPNAIAGNRVLKDAQILAIADSFDYLMKVEVGKASLSPLQAMQKIQEMNSKSGETKFDPDLLKSIMGLFQMDKKAA